MDSGEQKCGHRKGRGASKAKKVTKIKESKDRIKIVYNDVGQPIGEGRISLATYSGLTVKSLVKVTYTSWHKVPESIKKSLWTAIQAKFDLDPNSKNFVLASMARSWRAFKTQLAKKFIYPNEGNPELLKNPPPKYAGFLKQSVWEEFVKSRLSANFKKMSKEQSERRAKNKFPHRLSRKGYAGLNEDLKQQLGDKYIDDRSFSWTKARMSKDGTFTDEGTKEVAAKVEEYIKKKEDGNLVTEGASDILTLALGTPEHSGRIRGLGLGPTPTAYFNLPKRGLKKQNELLKCQLEEERKRRQELENLLKEFQAQGASQTSEKVASNTKGSDSKKYIMSPTNEPESLENKSTPSYGSKLKQKRMLIKTKDIPHPTSNIGTGTTCKLSVGTIDNIVAEGTIFEGCGRNKKIHNVELGEHNVRVSITKALQPTVGLPVPIYGEIEVVQDAIGSLVAWPKELVVGGLEESKKLIEVENVEPLKVVGSSRGIIETFAEMVALIKDTDPQTRVPIDKGMFGNYDLSCFLGKDVLVEVCRMGWLDVNPVLAYMRFLIDRFPNSRDHVIMFNPSAMTGAIKHKISNMVRDRLQEANKTQICFYPFIYRKCHWILLVVDLSNFNVYWLDSLSFAPRGDFKLYVNTGLKASYIGGKRPSKSPTWILPKVPKQAGGYECGYFVMKFMRDLLEDPSPNIESKLRNLAGKSTYTDEEIDDVRAEFVEYIASLMDT